MSNPQGLASLSSYICRFYMSFSDDDIPSLKIMLQQ
jgi:hypothetical protein